MMVDPNSPTWRVVAASVWTAIDKANTELFVAPDHASAERARGKIEALRAVLGLHVRAPVLQRTEDEQSPAGTGY